MKTPALIVLLGLCLAGKLFADDANVEAPRLAAAEVETLVAPIALYPDALIGIILPASANSTDLVLAARYLENGGTQEQVDSQSWDKSVSALARYPEVLKWMDENLAWAQQLGATFLVQSEDVMAAIQRLRVRAQTLGNLPSTEQLTVINQDNYVRIVPTVPETIYVPYYDPEVIYVSRFYWGFGPAWASGPWLTYDCNWVGRSIWIGPWAPAHFYRPEWRLIGSRPPPPHYSVRHTWRPDPRRIAARPPQPPPRPGNIVRPRPIGNEHRNRFDQPPAGGSRPAHLNGQQRPPERQYGQLPGDGRDPRRTGQPPPPRGTAQPRTNLAPPAPQGDVPATATAPTGSVRQRPDSPTRRPAVTDGRVQPRPGNAPSPEGTSRRTTISRPAPSASQPDAQRNRNVQRPDNRSSRPAPQTPQQSDSASRPAPPPQPPPQPPAQPARDTTNTTSDSNTTRTESRSASPDRSSYRGSDSSSPRPSPPPQRDSSPRESRSSESRSSMRPQR